MKMKKEISFGRWLLGLGLAGVAGFFLGDYEATMRIRSGLNKFFNEELDGIVIDNIVNNLTKCNADGRYFDSAEYQKMFMMKGEN